MRFWLLFFVVFVLDRLTKLWIVTTLSLGDSLPVWPGFFHITYVENPGAAFGILTHQKGFFIIMTLLVLGFIFYLAITYKGKSFLFPLALGLISGGALGNLIDRIHTGLVIDFLDFCGIWPYIFNVADVALSVGFVLLIGYILKSDLT